LLENNVDIIPDYNKHILRTFRDHVEGFKNNQLNKYKSKDIPLFPSEVYNIFE